MLSGITFDVLMGFWGYCIYFYYYILSLSLVGHGIVLYNTDNTYCPVDVLYDVDSANM